MVHEQGNSSLETRCAGVKQGLREHREPAGQRAGPAVGAADHPGQARPGHLDHRHRHPRRRHRRRRRPGPGRRRHLRQDRHLRPQPRGRAGDQGQEDRVLRRPAALPAGLRGRRLAVAAADQRQRHRWRQAGADRPVVRRRHQHRQDRRLRREQHPLTATDRM